MEYTGSFFLSAILSMTLMKKPIIERGITMNEKRVYIYAFNKVWNLVDVKFLMNEAISVQNMRIIANWMRSVWPEELVIYAVDNRPGLYKEFRDNQRSNDFTKHIEFADMISREGILLK